MTVKDIIALAAQFAQRQDIADYFKFGTADELTRTLKDCDLLLRCFNLVENEVALDYLPLTTTEVMSSQSGVISYADLKMQALDIISVSDEFDNKLKHKTYADYFKTAPTTVKVKYSYIPNKKALEDVSSYKPNQISKKVLAMGVACEFLLLHSSYDEAIMWDKRYKDALIAACKTKTKGRAMPAGRWF